MVANPRFEEEVMTYLQVIRDDVAWLKERAEAEDAEEEGEEEEEGEAGVPGQLPKQKRRPGKPRPTTY